MKRILVLSCVLIGSLSAFAQQSLNGNWSFRTDPNNRGENEGWHKTNTTTTNWDSLPVPGNWDLRNEYAHYVGKGWYRRTFPTPVTKSGSVVRLTFEAIYNDCTVWLNGQKLGENHSGFLPFEFEITDKLNASGPNVLAVCADNSFTRGAIWNWGGIRRPVTLHVSEPVRIVRQHITPTVNLAEKTATVQVRIFVQNQGNQPTEAVGTVQLSAPNGFARSLPFRVKVPASTTASILVQTNLTPKEAHWWHFDDPFLYTSTVNLTGQPGLTNPTSLQIGLQNRFGLRKIEIDNQAYTLKLNGESIRPMGFNLVPDDRTTGNTLPTWRIKEDIDLLKGLGCTMTRLSHLCLPEEMLDYLDERGMLVVSEIPLWGFDRLADPANETSKDWLNRLITNQYNHPSVICWSVGNEIGDYPTVLPYVKGAIAHARSLDSTRLVSSVSHTANNPTDIVDMGDIGLINKYSMNLAPITRRQHELHPSKTLFYTEYGAGQLAENLDANLNAHLLIDSIRNLPYLIGASLWTFNDYRSHFVGTKEISENRPWGVVDVYRRKKRAYYTFRNEQTPVRNLTIKLETSTSATVTLVPRGKLDLPAYPLHGYRLLWKRTDAAGTIRQAGLLPLPDIRPGDATVNQKLAWNSDTAFAMILELLGPTGDSFADTTIHLRKPAPVRITYAIGGRTDFNNTSPNSGIIRVHFAKTPTATAYVVRYGTESLTQQMPATLNDFVDIPKLAFGTTYRVAVVGMNGAGTSEPIDIQSVIVDKLHFSPPGIQHIEPTDRGFFVGYASVSDDYLYRIQVTQKPGDYANAVTVQTTNPGTLHVPNLTNGQPYSFRFQRVKDNWADSQWSEERTVTPDGGQPPATPTLQGVVRQQDVAVVCFEPVAKATGYVLHYRRADQTTSPWSRQTISTAQVGHYILSGLTTNKPYQFRLAALNGAGQSSFSSIIDAQQYAQSRSNR